MRLLNTSTFTLGEFTGSDIPAYAILSHRWGKQEITFQDVRNFRSFSDYFRIRKATRIEGWSKIKGCCAQAVLDGIQWIWVDSCCIDKMSSAELSEAINSMFNWYRQAVVCYAYLSDVPNWEGDEHREELMFSFHSSRWFTRGWTLQELLAPKKLIFFNRDWREMGTREKLWPLVSETTGIKNEMGWEVASVAQKMSWASKRETTRIEDQAYSLMGLFSVNMPPLYGEGEKAFLRLQLEILRTSDDESIFAWQDPQNFSGGLLARSPWAFQESGHVKRFESIHHDKPPYSMTNKGLRMEFSLVPAAFPWLSILDADDTFLAPLQCMSEKDYTMLAVLLRCIRGSQFTRISSGELISLDRWDRQTLARIERDPDIRRIVQVKQEDDSELSFRGFFQYKFSIAANLLSLKEFEVSGRYISGQDRLEWENNDGEERLLIDRVNSNKGMTAALEFTKRESNKLDRFLVIFNVYATRARLGIFIPQDDLSIDQIASKFFRSGDWMTEGHDLFQSKKLRSDQIINARLLRNENELGLRSYEAEITFQRTSRTS